MVLQGATLDQNAAIYLGDVCDDDGSMLYTGPADRRATQVHTTSSYFFSVALTHQ